MITATSSQRQTKYSQALKALLDQRGHATNTELLLGLRTSFPDISATTIHRITTRMAARGDIALAPATRDGAMRYDANTVPHDHFMCNGCDMLRDTDVKDAVVGLIESGIDGCHISGRLTVSGNCKKCKEDK